MKQYRLFKTLANDYKLQLSETKKPVKIDSVTKQQLIIKFNTLDNSIIGEFKEVLYLKRNSFSFSGFKGTVIIINKVINITADNKTELVNKVNKIFIENNVMTRDFLILTRKDWFFLDKLKVVAKHIKQDVCLEFYEDGDCYFVKSKSDKYMDIPVKTGRNFIKANVFKKVGDKYILNKDMLN